MTFTKQQLSIFLDESVLFRISSNENCIIDYNQSVFLTFDELERIVKRNYDYWNSISKEINNSFSSSWENVFSNVRAIRKYLNEAIELNIDDINNFLYYNISRSREDIGQNKFVYNLIVDAPIDLDNEIRKIKSFVTFYIEQTDNRLTEAVKNYIYLFKNIHLIGNYLANSSREYFFPALFLLRKNLSNIKENVSDFENNIVVPLEDKLKDISDSSDEQFKEITSLIEELHTEIQQRFNEKVSEFVKLQNTINNWQEEKIERIRDLEETYKNKLSLEAPESLWNERAKESSKKAAIWTCVLILAVALLILVSTKLVIVIHSYSLNAYKEIPFLSESFILITVISFFIYIVRVIIKIVMSNHHLATEYRQKATLTRFYQSLTYAGTNIGKEERLIIINSLFSRVDTGLIKIDSSNDSEALLAILSKNMK